MSFNLKMNDAHYLHAVSPILNDIVCLWKHLSPILSKNRGSHKLPLCAAIMETCMALRQSHFPHTPSPGDDKIALAMRASLHKYTQFFMVATTYSSPIRSDGVKRYDSTVAKITQDIFPTDKISHDKTPQGKIP